MGAPAGSRDASFDAQRPAQHPHTLVVTIAGQIDRSDAARFAALVDDELRTRPARVVICDVGRLAAADVAAVDAICRMRLSVRRLGGRLRLRHASRELMDLIDLMGLCEALSTRSRSALEMRR